MTAVDFNEWRKLVAGMPDHEGRLQVLREAARDTGRKLGNGLAKPDAVDALIDIAEARDWCGIGRDKIERLVGEEIERGERERQEVDETVRGWEANGRQRDVIDVASKPDDDTPAPLPYVDLVLDLVPRRWLVLERIPSLNVSLLSGEGGKGKTLLLMQLSAAVVLGRDWLGTMPEQGKVLYLSAEEDDDEVRRRMEAVARHYGSTRADLIESGLHMLSFAGKDAVLGQPDRNGLIRPTQLFERLKREAARLRPKLIVLDAAADVFAGKEMDRAQTRQFITLSRGMAIAAEGAVVIAAHPSLTGISSGTGLSGSTAWHNSVRARLYFKAAPGDDASRRVLEVQKNNYGPVSEALLVRWKEGVYILEPRAGSLEQMAAEQKVDQLFLKLLRRYEDRGRNVTDKKGTSFAPALFADEPDAKAEKVTNKHLADAMTRLFAAGKIRVVSEGPTSKKRSKIIESCGEEPASTNSSTTPSTNFQQPPTNVPPLSPHTPP